MSGVPIDAERDVCDRDKRSVGVLDMHDAVDARGTFQADHPFAESQPERDFRQRAVTVADRNETPRTAQGW